LLLFGASRKIKARRRQGSKVKQIVMDEGLETLLWFDANSCDILKERITALKDIFPDNGILRR